jgi:hypothetical protein
MGVWSRYPVGRRHAWRIERVIKRTLANHKALAIALPAIAVVAFLATSLALAAGVGGTSQAGATPSVTPSDIPSTSPSDSPTPFFSPTPTPNLGPTPLPAGMAYSDLDGVAASTNLAHRLPIAIMIDDNKAARPQSGISSASIVYQAPADGGEDRYMMVFQEGTATDIGPVRSARPYYVRWAAEYKAMFGHYGGDWTTINKTIPSLARYLYNMDNLHGGSCPYHRINTRVGPHNAYTNSAAQIRCAIVKGYPATYQNLPTRPFKGDTASGLLPTAQTISIAYRTGTIGYQFNPTTDSYLRLVGGAPEIDPANGKQVFARSIVVMDQFLTTYAEPGHGSRPVVATVGYGPVTVFQEGRVIKGTWKKKNDTALTRFYDSAGKEIALVRGEIFIQSRPPQYKMSVK